MPTGVAFCMAITLKAERDLAESSLQNRHYHNEFDAINQSFAASTSYLFTLN
jgi:hypothetical protein